MFKILRVKKFPIYDVFTGEGWLDWTRFLFQHGKLVYLQGEKRTQAELKQITKALGPTKNANPIN